MRFRISAVAAAMALGGLSACSTMVDFNSVPPGASVSYRGQVIGQTPFRYELYDQFGWWSTYTFSAAADGFKPASLSFQEKTPADAQFIVPDHVNFILEPVAPPPPVVAAAAPEPPPVPAPVPVPVAPPAPPPVDNAADVQAAVQAWAAAWSQRDLPGYVAAYTPTFKGDRATHAAWLAERRSRIVPRKAISVQLSDVRVSVANDVAQVHFTQAYVSGSLKQTQAKTLELRRSPDGKWLIDREAVQK